MAGLTWSGRELFVALSSVRHPWPADAGLGGAWEVVAEADPDASIRPPAPTQPSTPDLMGGAGGGLVAFSPLGVEYPDAGSGPVDRISSPDPPGSYCGEQGRRP